MRTMSLVAVVASAALLGACGGMSPTNPTASLPAQQDEGFLTASGIDPTPCSGITHVNLQVVPQPSMTKLLVRATYLERGKPSKCAVSPAWSARPNGRLIPTRDPFVVMVTRTVPPSDVSVSAESPNAVRGSIRVR